MSTTGVLVTGRRRRRPSLASLTRIASVAWNPQSYRNLLYLVLALPLGIAYVTVLAVGLSAGAGLAVILVGLVLLLATVFALRAMAAVERMLARKLLRITIHPPIEGGIDLPWRQRVQLWLRDPVTWKSLIYLLGKLPMGIVAYALLAGLGFTALVLTFAPVLVVFTPVIFFGWEVDDPLTALIGVPLGILLLVASLHLSNGLAWLYGVCARIMLGPSSVDLRERVEGLRDASARILTAADDERRRIERDLHDGAQQRLVALNVLLGVVESKIGKRPEGRRPARRPRAPGGPGGGQGAARARPRHPPGPARRPRADRGARGARPARARSRSPSRASPRAGSRPRSRRPPTSSPPRRSPTSPSTRRPRRPASRCPRTAAACASPCPTTGSAARTPSWAPACAGCTTASPRWTGASRSARRRARAP